MTFYQFLFFFLEYASRASHEEYLHNWSSASKHKSIHIRGPNTLEYYADSQISDARKSLELNLEINWNKIDFSKVDWTEVGPALIQTENYIPMSNYRFYFELEIENIGDENSIVAIGLSARPPFFDSLPGLIDLSCGYYSDGSILHNGKNDLFDQGDKYGKGDIVGCYGDLKNGLFYFTKNGFVVNEPRANPTERIDIVSDKLFPTIGLKGDGTRIKSNFGKEKFIFFPDSKFALRML